MQKKISTKIFPSQNFSFVHHYFWGQVTCQLDIFKKKREEKESRNLSHPKGGEKDDREEGIHNHSRESHRHHLQCNVSTVATWVLSKCVYCQPSGDVLTLKGHTSEIHPGQILRVVIGYMECQLCGYLSSGIEKHLQNNHFHEEHPLESEVICSKYMSKTNTTGTEAFSNSQQAFKI